MLVILNTQNLIDNKLTANECLFVTLIADNSIELLKKYTQACNLSEEQISQILHELENKNLVTFELGKIQSLEHVKITKKASELLYKDNYFQELVDNYPKKVTRTDGTIDFLRTDLTNTEIAYRSYVGRSRDKHDHILKCLKAEIKHRESTNTMAFMRRMYYWVLNRGWESYEDIIDDFSTDNIDLGYGTKLI